MASSSSLLVLGLTILLAIFSILIFQLYKFRNSEIPSKLPPGTTGWPIIGETLNFILNPKKFMQDRMIKYSPDVFKTSFAGEKMVIFFGPSANKFFYSNEANLFTPWVPRSIMDVLSQIDLSFTSPSSKLLMDQLHKFLKIDSMKHLVSLMDAKARDHLEIHWVPYKEVKVQPLVRDFTLALACRLFINFNKPEQVKELYGPFTSLFQGILSPPVNIPGTPYYRAMKEARVIKQILTDAVRLRKVELSSNSSQSSDDQGQVNDVKDILGQVLMASHMNGENINEQEIVGRITGLIFAGFHSTSNAITFAISHLAEHPDVYEKVLKEQLEIAQSKGPDEELLTWIDIQKMKYLWNVVCESMRLTPAGLGGFREAGVDFTYAGFKIPKGWKVHWSVHSTNMDPKYFPDPEKFDPSRFEGNKVPPFAFVPFGGGPRMCCGKEYARIETLVYLHNVITRFKLKKANPNEKIVYRADPVPTEGLQIKLQLNEK